MSAVSRLALLFALIHAPLLASCGDEDAGAVAFADFGADTAEEARFFDLPFPSDLRLTPDGRPDLAGYPRVREVTLLAPLLQIAEDRPGFSTLPVAYFRFDGELPTLDEGDVIAAEPNAKILLVDVDPGSPRRGALTPVVASTLAADRYTGEGLLAVAPRPGFVLEPDRAYAVVVTRGLGDARGARLGVPDSISRLAKGLAPAGSRGEAAVSVYAPMFETLDTLGVARDEVAVATVFTTGDVVREMFDLAEAEVQRRDVTIQDAALAEGGDHPDYCEIHAELTLPQFQTGEPPFDAEGRFEFDASGALIEQRTETIPVVITIPKEPAMPAEGYPLMIYFHGSGGVATQIVDRGPRDVDGVEAPGEGPAFVIARRGFAAVGAALPLSPDRLPGAGAQAYLNFNNLAAFRDTFRQGAIEQRLMIEALTTLRIAPEALGACAGPTLPAEETEFHFNPAAFVGLGQSMGGMYVNIIGAIEPALRALVPTGAGGHWSYFILETSLIPGAAQAIALLLGVEPSNLSFLHPAMNLLALAWEPAEPLVYMPRLSRRPLPELYARPIYEPVGEGDSYFPTPVFDAVALAYGHPMAGDEIWGSMREALALADLDALAPYPVSSNLRSSTGESYTAAVVQYEGDGFSDPHGIYMQLEDVRYQWSCFLHSAVHGEAGAVIPAPAPIESACPE